MKTAFQKTAEQQVIKDGKWQPVCVTALSSNYPAAEYNICPDAVPFVNDGAVFADDGIHFNSAGYDYINLGNDASFTSDLKEVTYSALVTLNSVTSFQGIIGSTYDDPSNQISLQLHNTLEYRFRVYGTGNALSNQAAYSNFTPQAGDTYLVTGTYDGEFVRIYIDGELKGETAYAATLVVSSNNDILVGRYPAAAAWLDGKLNNVMILNKALSGSEVKALAEQLIGV